MSDFIFRMSESDLFGTPNIFCAAENIIFELFGGRRFAPTKIRASRDTISQNFRKAPISECPKSDINVQKKKYAPSRDLRFATGIPSISSKSRGNIFSIRVYFGFIIDQTYVFLCAVFVGQL